MLEIGVQTGESIRMWHEYFPAAKIIGVDIAAVDPLADLARYTFKRGSQEDFVFLTGLAQTHDFHVVIDDGSHLWGHQIFSFQTILPWLRPGSIYICEDIHTSFGPIFPEQYSAGAPESAGSYFGRLAMDISAGSERAPRTAQDPLYEGILQRIRSVTFIRQSVIIEI
ncbi:MAG: class I SAM-dependent methyltransferase [Thermomicrobiales bacterium]